MKCSNCGAELRDGTIVCPRCGKRQSGGLNNDGGGKKRGGLGVGKVFAIVASIVVVVGLSIFAFNKIKPSRPNDLFTHDTTFEKDNLSVTQDKVLRYRDVLDTKTFNLWSQKGYVDVTLLDEQNNKVDFKVQQGSRSDLYVISPVDKWDSKHTYNMSLGEGTYFSDEDMYQFNKLIYTIKKEDVANYKLNRNIIELSDNPNYQVKEGDVVGYNDEKGNKKYGRAVLKNGVISYENAGLTDIFEELKLVGEFEPDYSNIEWNDEGVKEFLYDIKQSKFFLNLVQTVYATELIKGIKSFKVKNIPIEELCKIDVEVKPSTEKKQFFEISKEAFVLSINMEFSALNGKLFGHDVKDDSSVVIELTKKIIIDFKPDIDLDWSGLHSFDVQLSTYFEDIYGVDIKWEKKYENNEREPLVTLRAGDNIESQITDDMDAAIKSKTLLAIGKNELETKKIYRLIKNIPIPTPIPAVTANIAVDINGNFEAEVKFGIKTSALTKTKVGLSWSESRGLDWTRVIEKGGSVEGHLEGELSARIGISPTISIGAGLFEYRPVDLGVGFELGPYFKASGNIKVKTLDRQKQSSFSGHIDPSTMELDFKRTSTTEGVSVEGEGSIEAGLYAQVYVFGKIQLYLTPIFDGRYYFLNDEFPFAQHVGSFKIDKDGLIATASTIRIGEIGSVIDFGPYKFKVMDRDSSKGIALIVAEDGIDAKPYFDPKIGGSETSCAWAVSTLRKYLNGEFLRIFRQDEADSIYDYKIKAEANQKFGIDAGNDTVDKVFILSRSELERYYRTDKDRQLKASGAAIAAGAYVSTETDKERHRLAGNTIYWTRNPGSMSIWAMVVNSDGSINEEGAPVSREDICIRPAMWVRDQFYVLNVRKELLKARDGIIDLQYQVGDLLHGKNFK